MSLNLTMTCTAYDRNQALLNCTVKPDGVNLDIHIDPEGGQFRLTHAREGKYDIIEFHIGMYIADLPYRTLGYTAIPIFGACFGTHIFTSTGLPVFDLG
jgi:4,5-dihydroxyphthalate decarboxylase